MPFDFQVNGLVRRIALMGYKYVIVFLKDAIRKSRKSIATNGQTRAEAQLECCKKETFFSAEQMEW